MQNNTAPNASPSIVVLTFLLAACGGGGGSGGVNFIPPVPPSQPPPTSQPPPPPTPPALPSGPIGLQSDKAFKTFGAWADGWGSIASQADAVQITYSTADGRYTITLPEYQEGVLLPKSGNGTFNANGWVNLASIDSDVGLGAGPARQNVTATLDWPPSTVYSYTSFGRWSGSRPFGHNSGVFAYGVPTIGGDMPLTGKATYAGEIRGLTNGEPFVNGGVGPVLDVSGSVTLSFDFGAGTLNGHMEPVIAPAWDAISLGTYTFRNTIYERGSTSFKGAFEVPGSSAESSFLGSFTGPQGAELMASWRAPFKDTGAGGWGMMSGTWIAKRSN